MNKTVHVKLGDRSYDITIGRNLPVGSALRSETGLRAMIVSDSNVDSIYGDACARKLRREKIESTRVVVPAGEKSKNWKQVVSLYDKALEFGLERSSVIVALGGGVVGDLAGFAAATYQRGIRLIQVPTSLLAMVDSSVGGKTGINLPQGKNMVGAFHQPVEVVADLATLDTLPEREYVSALAEVVKYGVISDAAFFRYLEKNAGPLLSRDDKVLREVVARCCEIKADVVGADERDLGLRAILNFGHTMGHAIEAACGYGTMLHGEAVSLGMAYAARLSVRATGLDAGDDGRLLALLSELGLPVSMPGRKAPKWKTVRALMTADKKTKGRVPRFVLAKRLGAVVTGYDVPDEMLAATYTEAICQA